MKDTISDNTSKDAAASLGSEASRKFSNEVISNWNVVTPSRDAHIQSSGAKWLPRVEIGNDKQATSDEWRINHPTHGVDPHYGQTY